MRRSLILSVLGGILVLAAPEEAAAQCPAGTVQVGERRVQEGNVIGVHPVCRRIRTYRHSGSGLVGGTGWRLGYYSPVGAPPEVQAVARRMLRDQARLAGARYDEQIDFERYNFALGIANDTRLWVDLATRVVFEQLRNGQLTASSSAQGAYNQLRDRQFDELGCHSNGAMICLAALMNGDVMADNVVLYGPQVTTESLALWNQLLERRRISSLRVIVAQNDPIAPVALLSGMLLRGSGTDGIVANAPVLFEVSALASTLRRLTPRAAVSTFPCGGRHFSGLREPFECHDMQRYAEYARRCPPPRAQANVPGTRNPGGRRVAEPPPPCQ